MTSNLLLTKLYRPTVPIRHVKRPFLTLRLQDGLAAGRQLTLVSAPAGFGKTTCICEWLDEKAEEERQKAEYKADSIHPSPFIFHPSRVAWLSLDEADNDPGRFFAYLVAALQRVDDSLGQEIQTVIRDGQLPPVEGISTNLINDILLLNKHFLLVLDDVQVIEERIILQVLEQLVTNMPQPLHLVLITREDPPLPLARLRANNELTEIRAEDLRFKENEADTFLREVMALSLSQDESKLLEERTEGWVVGLQLAGLSIRDRADTKDFINHLSGSHRHILSYLTEEVLYQQSPEIQQFLLETAVLDKLTGELCDAVTGGDNGRALLEKLYKANLFLIPLDDNRQWYRYHHLFADLLRTQLQQSKNKQTVQALHGRASQWLAKHDFIDEAIQHALLGQDYDTAATLIEKAAHPLIFSGQMTTVNNWIRQLSEDALSARPRLAIYRIWLDIIRGKVTFIGQALQEMEALLNMLPPSPENNQIRLEMSAILCRLVALVGDSEKAITIAENVLASLPESEQASRARAYSALAIANGMDGRMAPAISAYQECMHLAQSAGYFSLAAHTTMIFGQGLTQIGRLREAAQMYQTIIDMGEASGQKLFFPAGQGYVGLADILLEWHELDQASSYVQKGIELCSQGGLAGAMGGVLIQARLLQARGKLKEALKKIDNIPGNDGTVLIGLALRQVQIRRTLGDIDSLSRWEMPLMAMLSGQLGPLSPVLIEAVQLILIRIYLAQEKDEDALTMLAELEKTAEAGQRNGRLIEVNLLRALILKKQGENAAAQEAFIRSLLLAEPENFVMLYLEEGNDVRTLLQTFLNEPSPPQHLRQYAQKLLTAFPGEVEYIDPLIEPLSGREQEILKLIGAGYSNQEISEELVITLHTVKKHSSNIYGKLGVNSRTQAVARARELRLL